jgi:hypothetical protein
LKIVNVAVSDVLVHPYERAAARRSRSGKSRRSKSRRSKSRRSKSRRRLRLAPASA